MQVWVPNPSWQNFSSLFREATAAQEVRTGMERAHHLTASLYFGLAAVESFFNERMRTHMAGRPDQEIDTALRHTEFKTKLRKWPTELSGKSNSLRNKTIELLLLFYDIRGHLIHPKTDGHAIYSRLEKVRPGAVVEAVAESIVRIHEAEGTVFPYWIFGWNYFNPRPNSYDIFVVNNQQFCFSLQALGFNTNAATGGDQFQQEYLTSFDGYLEVSRALSTVRRCEPKNIFPYQPKLCRRWWTSEHQQTCGNVTKQALDAAMRYGAKGN